METLWRLWGEDRTEKTGTAEAGLGGGEGGTDLGEAAKSGSPGGRARSVRSSRSCISPHGIRS